MKMIDEYVKKLFSDILVCNEQVIDLKEEIKTHLIDSTKELMRKGFSQEVSFFIARSRFGSLNELKKEFASLFEEKQEMNSSKATNIIAIGCSTGGPKSLKIIADQLEKNIPAAILVAQHMPEGNYIKTLAEFLNNTSPFRVKEAEDNEEILNGTMYIAPGGYHMQATRKGNSHFISTYKIADVNGHQPSVDVLFQSLVNISIPLYCAILSGMGNDGLNGIRNLRTKKENLIVASESKTTASVFGMPRQIEENGLSDFISEIQNIIPSFKRLIV